MVDTYKLRIICKWLCTWLLHYSSIINNQAWCQKWLWCGLCFVIIPFNCVMPCEHDHCSKGLSLPGLSASVHWLSFVQILRSSLTAHIYHAIFQTLICSQANMLTSICPSPLFITTNLESGEKRGSLAHDTLKHQVGSLMAMFGKFLVQLLAWWMNDSHS